MHILIVDSDPAVQARVVEFVKKGHEVVSCADGAQALQALEKRTFDVVLADVEVIQRARDVSPGSTFVLLPPRGAAAQLRETLDRLGLVATAGAKVFSIAGGATNSNTPTVTVPQTGQTEGDRAVAQLASRGLTNLVEELESRLVLEAMSRTRNNQIRAAEVLKITRGALQYKLKKYVKPQAA